MADMRERAKLARAAARLNAQSCPKGDVPALALLTDDLRLANPGAAIAALPRGSLVILRTRNPVDRDNLACLAAPVCRARAHQLLIADDPAAVLRHGADGLHLPQARNGELRHWRIRRPDWFLTCAAHDLVALQRAARDGANAALLSPVFATQSHPGAKPLGPYRLAALLRAARLPVYALGGVDARTCLRLRGLPLAGVAAIGALAA